MNTFFVYDGKSENLQKALDIHDQCGQVLCHHCGTQLLVFPDWQSASKHEKRPGIYCPVSEKHIYQCFILSDRHEEVWRRFNQWKEDRES